jgi:5-methylcytosine-specific restriction endonuclease McrA
MVMMKVKSKKCSKCGEVKELGEFYKNSRNKDGYRNDCKVCFKAYCKNLRNKWKKESTQGTKKCPRCRKEKSLKNFHKDSTTKSGYRIYCKLCVNLYTRQYNIDNVEYRNEYNRNRYYTNRAEIRKQQKKYGKEYRANNRKKLNEASRNRYWKNHEYELERKKIYNENHPEVRKAQKAKRRALLIKLDKHFTAQEWKEILNKYENKCLCCGSTENITVDHIIPLSCGGTNIKDNLQPLCLTCNIRKHTKTIDYRDENNQQNRTVAAQSGS